MSHGDQKQKAKLVERIRALEKEFRRPTTILFDLQGPKLRVGHFEGGRTVLENGPTLHLRPARRRPAQQAGLPAPRGAVRNGPAGHEDPDRRRQGAPHTSSKSTSGRIVTRGEGRRRGLGQQGRQRARRGRAHSGADRQGPRRPSVRARAARRLDRLSFVQRPEDVAEARSLIGERASLLAKIEKPAAIDRLNDIIALADAVMVARGDLGVELPPEQVPPLQNRIVGLRAPVRQAGRRRDADAGIDGDLADADARRGQRRRDRDLRRRRRGDALGGKRHRAISVRGGADDGPDRDRASSAIRATRRGSTSPRRGSSRPPRTRSPGRRGRSRAPSRPPRCFATRAPAQPPGASRASVRPCPCWR